MVKFIFVTFYNWSLTFEIQSFYKIKFEFQSNGDCHTAGYTATHSNRLRGIRPLGHA